MSGRVAFSRDNSNSAFSQGGSVLQTTPVAASLYQQALTLHRQNRFNDAATLYQHILYDDPNHAGAMHFLGMVAFAQRRYHDALGFIEHSLELCDTKAVYHNNHGVVLKELKRHEDARTAFEKAVSLNPNYADALSNLGMICVLLDEPDQNAERYLKKALQLQPNHVDAIRQLSDLYLKNHLHFEALPFLERLAFLTPPSVILEHSLACVYGECGDIKKSKEHFRNAASLPGGQDVWRHKHLWYCPTFFENEKQIDEYWKNLDADLDGAIAEKNIYNWKTLVNEGFTHSFNLPHLNRCCKDILEKYSKLFAPSFEHFERPDWEPGEKIRVGFLVTPGHEGGFLRLCSGLIEQLDSERFEVVLIYNETTASKYENRFERENLIHVPYSWNFERAVQTIRDAKCDVIYYWKVGADAWNFFLPMCQLAPVQCTSWSTQGTSGVSQIDYYVSWDKAEIPDAQKHYTEELYFLETTPLYEPIPKDIPRNAVSRSELGLPEQGTIYFCPHQMPKYHPMFDEYLCEILQRDRTGHLLILHGHSMEWNSRLTRRISNRLGPDLMKRVRFLLRQSFYDYYRYLSLATVVLHSPVFSGEITAVDGFLYGVPYVTQTGEFLVQRYSTAFYDEFGIKGLAVSNREDYVGQAVKLGTDPQYRSQIVNQIHANRSSFFNNEKTVREWERFITQAISAPPSH